MSTLTYKDVEKYGSMIFGILLETGEAKSSELACQCKISIKEAEECLEVLHKQGLVERRGDKWRLYTPSDDSSVMQDASPHSESELCSQLERSHISCEQTRKKEVDERVLQSTRRKEPYSSSTRGVENSDDEETELKQPLHSRSGQSSASSMSSIEQLSAGGSPIRLQAGGVNLSTTAPVQMASSTTPDPALKPYHDQLCRIIELFRNGARDKRPHDIAKLTNIGQAKKDVNKLLYVLEKYKILRKKCNENQGNPLWNAGENINTFTEKELFECAAEVAKGKPLQKSTDGGSDGDTHIHHHHHHQHNTYIQAGMENRLLINQASGSSRAPVNGGTALPGPQS